jgi:O-antigen ligase
LNIRKISFFWLFLFILSIPCEDTFALGSFGSLSKIIGLISMFCWMLSVIVSKKIRKFHPLYLFIVLFILWNFISIIWSFDIPLSIDRLITYVQLAFLSWILWDQVTEKNKILLILQAYILGAYISITGTIYNFVKGKEAFTYSGGRFAANGFNADDLAMILVIGLPIAWYLILKTDQQNKLKLLNLVNIMYIPLSFFALILTGSRAGFLCSLISMAYFIVTFLKQRLWIKVFLVIIMLFSIFSIFTLIPESTIQRVSNSFEDLKSGSLSGRETIFFAAAQLINNHPIIGIGAGAFKTASGTDTFAHNTILSVLAETGVIGLFLFFCIIFISFLEVISQPKIEAYFWFTVLLIWGVGVNSLSWEFQKPTWVILNLITVSASIYANKYLSSQNSVFLGIKDKDTKSIST